jgi:pyruvate/2-oxoglutarate dehydrogenase complex dihydrolipoamide dehydrogenase (E3) component
MTEGEARERGIGAAAFTVPLASVDRALLDGEEEGFARLVVRKGSGAILGCTLVARHAGESIGEVVLAMANGLGVSAVARTIHPYPTQAEAIRKGADAWSRGRLTPAVKGLLSAWLRWRRG